jgi:hypothetical protein
MTPNATQGLATGLAPATVQSDCGALSMGAAQNPGSGSGLLVLALRPESVCLDRMAGE